MSVPLQFETPENVRIEQRPAGLGTRFIAWIIDNIIVVVLLIILTIGFIVIAVTSDSLAKDWLRQVDDSLRDDELREHPERIGLIVLGVGLLIWNFGSTCYFALSELFWRGQTLGKSLCGIRIVKANGFALDPLSVLVRNLFRFADQLPVLWVVPFLSARGQRVGDMVGGTLVVTDGTEELPEIREELLSRPPAEARFHFDRTRLARLTREEFDAIEQILDRWNSISGELRRRLLARIIAPICRKLQMEEPQLEQRIDFLEDLLLAEYRRQERHLI